MTDRESTNDYRTNVDIPLSRFDKLRASHPVFSSELPESSNAVVLEKYKAELSCKICYNLLKDPVLSRTCMHRFCTLCVVDGGKIIVSSCPECGARFSGNPAFLKDHNFADIIKKMLPRESYIQRRSILTVLKATGIDIDGYFKNEGKIPTYRNDNEDWIKNYATTSNINDIESSFRATNNGTNGINDNGKIRNSNGISRSYMWRMQVKSNDIIHLNTEYGAIQLSLDQLDNLPFHIESNSVKPMVYKDIGSSSSRTYSLCNDQKPTFIADLESVYVPTKFSKESKKLLISLPSFILRLFPKDFQNQLLKEKQQIPDEPILTHRQLLNRGMLLGLVLYPDSSVIKSKTLPKCLKFPRYIYGPPSATVGHLKEFLYTRALVEADFRIKDNFILEFARVIKEKKEINLRITAENESGQPISNNSQQKGELLLKVRCGQESIIKKRDTLIIIKHPFQPLEKKLNIKELATNSRILGRPLKIVFRITPILR